MKSVPAKEHPVYKFLKTFGTQTEGYSNRQIAAIMGRPINTVTPRIFELRAAGVVVLAGKRKDLYSGVTVSHWRIASEVEEAALKAPTPRVVDTLENIPDGMWLALGGPRDMKLLISARGGYTSFSWNDGKNWSSFQGYFANEDKMYGPFQEVL
jgi:hypothetical protein